MSEDRAYADMDDNERADAYSAYLDDLGASQHAAEQEAADPRPLTCYWCARPEAECGCESNAELEANRQAGRA